MAMTLDELQPFLDVMAKKHPGQCGYVSFLIPEGPAREDVEELLKEIRAMGYAAFVRTGPFDEEVVVTDYVQNTDTRSPRDETSGRGTTG
jgi:hypothetical protein